MQSQSVQGRRKGKRYGKNRCRAAGRGGGAIMALRGRSDRSLLTRLGELELTFATLLLHASDLVQASANRPMFIRLEDIPDQCMTRISVGTAIAVSEPESSSDSGRSKPLAECRTYLQSHGATLRWEAPQQPALLTVDIPFAKPEEKKQENGS